MAIAVFTAKERGFVVALRREGINPDILNPKSLSVLVSNK